MNYSRFFLSFIFCLFFFPVFTQELVTNGDFETGDLTGWTVTTNPNTTQFLIVNDGTYISPTGCFNFLNPSGSHPPIDGNYSVLFDMSDAGTNQVTTTVSIPQEIINLIFSFEIEYAREGTSVIVVEILESNSSTIIGTVYSAGDNTTSVQSPTCITLNLTNLLSSYTGQNIDIRFRLQFEEDCIPAQIDNVSLRNVSEYFWENGQNASDLIGQANFFSGDANAGATTAEDSFNAPGGIAIDHQNNKLYVSDNKNNRVLRFAYPPDSNRPAAEAVFGQADFTSNSSGNGANRMNAPQSLAVDDLGNLWVADSENNRILRFEDAANKTNGANADGVLGQADFTATSSNNTASAINKPAGIFVDKNNRLWVADAENHRVLRFDDAANKANGADADGVLGQEDFISDESNTSINRMSLPLGVYLDVNGSLWVVELLNNRVLRFDDAANKTNGADADGVLGQINFTNDSPSTTASTFAFPSNVTGDARGNLYVLEVGNSRLMVFENAGSASNGSAATNVLGQVDFNSNAQVTSASGLKIDNLVQPFFDNKEEKLWIPDPGNHRILEFTPTTSPIIIDANYYVKTDGNDANDGQSWNNAFATLQKAIETAEAGQSIWVARGTYYPTADQNGNTDISRNLTFYVDKDLQIYGGFNGDEVNLSEQNPSTNPTILSGDIGVIGDDTDNSYHVIHSAKLSTNSLLDGFTIQDGNANGGSITTQRGGGWRNDAGISISSPTVRNCIFFNNKAEFGGAMHNNSSSSGEVSPLFFNCQFIGNRIAGQFAAGGAVYLIAASNGKTNSRFENCIFSGNGRDGNAEGGAIYLNKSSGTNASLFITNCSFTNNEASDGGAVAIDGSNIDVALRNSIFWNNEDEISGTNINISHSIFDDGTEDGSLSLPTGVTDGGNNLDSDPLFIDADGADNTVGTLDDNLLPSIFSPAADAGNNAFITTSEDITGAARINNSTVDIGAYELACPPVFVDADATSGNNDGSSWANAFLKLEDAIDIVTNCDYNVIWVAEGTYKRNEAGTGTFPRRIYYQFDSDVEIYGGFNGTEQSLLERDLSAHETILSGDIGIQGDISDNTHIIVRARAEYFLMDGFTITSGNNNFFDGVGGIEARFIASNNFHRQTFRNCKIENNIGRQGGGFNIDANISEGGDAQLGIVNLINCTFSNNESTQGGGAIYAETEIVGALELNIINCTFTDNVDNSINQDGDVLYVLAEGTGTHTINIQNSILWNEGTPIFNTNNSSTVTLSNSILKDNTEDGSVSIPTNVTNGGNNLDANPFFANVDNGDLTLLSCSPAIDAGLNTYVNNDTDLVGKPRVVNTNIDMGAHEFQALTRLEVNTIESGNQLIKGVDSIITAGILTITATDDVIFEATSAIILQVGFHAQAGSDFVARINDCEVDNMNITENTPQVKQETIAENRTNENSVVPTVVPTPDLKVKVFPNPFSNATNIQYYVPETKDLDLLIMDMTGKIYYQHRFNNPTMGWQTLSLNGNDFDNGIYFLLFRTSAAQVVKKLVVQKGR